MKVLAKYKVAPKYDVIIYPYCDLVLKVKYKLPNNLFYNKSYMDLDDDFIKSFEEYKDIELLTYLDTYETLLKVVKEYGMDNIAKSFIKTKIDGAKVNKHEQSRQNEILKILTTNWKYIELDIE